MSARCVRARLSLAKLERSAATPRTADAASSPLGPRAFWYAAVASQRLRDGPLAVRVLDADLVLFRDDTGAPRALDDRCIHRGAQLSLGEVRDGALACRYHGWRYGGDGGCVHIPSLAAGQSIPKGVGVRALPCAERDGYVWTWMGDAADPAEPPAIDGFAAFNWVQGATPLKCAALAAIENNLDWCHPVFTHPFTHGQFFINQAMGFRDQAIEMRMTELGLTVFSPPARSADSPIPDDVLTTLAFELPDRVTVSFAGGPQGPMKIVMHMVPTGPATCRQEWMVSTGAVADRAAPTIAWSDTLPTIFEQDRLVLESVQLAHDREGFGFERSVEADAPTLLARRIYALAIEGRWREGRGKLTQRRELRVRA